MWSPEDQYPHRAGPGFEADLNLTYLAPGAFTILPADVLESQPNAPMANSKHRLTPTARKRRNASFAIIAEPGSSNPGSRSPSPTGRVSPFRGRGFNPAGSRHASPLPSPPPTTTPRRSKIPLARKGGTAQMLGENTDIDLSKQLSKSLNNISPRRVPAKPPTGRYSKGAAFQKLSPIVGSSPEQTPNQQNAQSSKIPRSRSQPPSRTASRSTSRNASRNVSRESSPSKLSLTKISYKHVKSKVNSFNTKPKVPPKPTQVPSEDSADNTNSDNKIETEVVVETNGITDKTKPDSASTKTDRSAPTNKNEDAPVTKITNGSSKANVFDEIQVSDTSVETGNVSQIKNEHDAQVTSAPTLIDLLSPSTTTVVSSTTTTVTQPLKIDAKLELETKDDVYLPDARALSATSVSQAMNRMNDTILDTKTLMKETKLDPDVKMLSTRSVMSHTDGPQQIMATNAATNSPDVVALVATPVAQDVLPSVETKDSKVNSSVNTVGNHNSINGKIGIVTVSALPKSANERIKEARTLVAADVQPLRITVQEKPSNPDVQSGNVRMNMGVVNGVNDHPGLPPPQSPPEPQPAQPDPPVGCCTRFLKCCHKKTDKRDQPVQPTQSKSSQCSSCFSCMRKQNDKVLSKGSSDLSLIESQTNEAPKRWWKRLKCCNRNKVGDTTTGCFSKAERKESWIPKITEENVESRVPEKRSAKDICKNFLRTIFCINLCTRNRRRREAEEAMRRRASVLSKKKSLTPAPPEEPKYKLEAGLVEHHSTMKGAIPVLPVPLAWMCLILNSFLPGTGTILSGFLCLCMGKARFNQKDGFKQRFGAFVIDFFVGFGQAFTVLFCLVGWGWSIWWGIIMLKLARKHRKLRRAEKAMEEDEKRRSASEHPSGNDAEQGGS